MKQPRKVKRPPVDLTFPGHPPAETLDQIRAAWQDVLEPWLEKLRAVQAVRARNGRQTGLDRQIAEKTAVLLEELARKAEQRRGSPLSEWATEYVYGEDGRLHRANGSTGIAD